MSEGKFTFDCDQPWVGPKATRPEAQPRSSSAQHSSPQSSDDPRDDPVVTAASLLHSLSRADCRNQDDTFGPVDHVDHIINGDDDVPHPSSPNSSTFQHNIEARSLDAASSLSPNISISSPRHNIQSPATFDPYANTHSISTISPVANGITFSEGPTLSYVSSDYNHNDSPYTVHRNEFTGGAHDRDGCLVLEIQEACLVRCFADHLAQNVGFSVLQTLPSSTDGWFEHAV